MASKSAKSTRTSAFSVYSLQTPKKSSEESPEMSVQDGPSSSKKKKKESTAELPRTRSQDGPSPKETTKKIAKELAGKSSQDGPSSSKKTPKKTAKKLPGKSPQVGPSSKKKKKMAISPFQRKRNLEVKEESEVFTASIHHPGKKLKKNEIPNENGTEKNNSSSSPNENGAERNDNSSSDNESATRRTIFHKIKSKGAPCGNEAAEGLFQWMISPIKPALFFQENLDKKPLYVERNNPNYYDGVFSIVDFDALMRENNLDYEKEMDFNAYIDDQRQSITDKSHASRSLVWNLFREGYTIRMRNPQAYSKKLWNVCSLLQEYFSCFIGVNMYLTPANSQGFPPHYDDIDAFILQIEGSKKWKLYNPMNESEVLVRHSSSDLKDSEISEPFMEVEMKAGDLLYFPRGIIHQAVCSEEHSLHLTVSCNQLNTWGDLLQLGFSSAIEKAMNENIEFRKSLPKDYLELAGHVYSDEISLERDKFLRKFKSLASEALKYVDPDRVVDEHAIDFIHSSMPPMLSKVEEMCSARGRVANDPVTGKPLIAVNSKLTLQTKVRWIRKRAFRLVMDEDGAKLLHSIHNSMNHKGKDNLFLDVDEGAVPSVLMLFKSHPNFVKVADMPFDDDDLKLEVMQDLYDKGFLMTEQPLPMEL